MRYVLGIDIGTTSVKTILLSEEGKIEGELSRPHDLISFHPGWAEEDANVWWKNVKDCIQYLSEEYPEKIRNVCCIGCCGMVPSTVILDKDGVPLRLAIQQNDFRTREEIASVKKAINQNWLYDHTGSYTNQQHILPRLLWLQKNEPQVLELADSIMGSYDYILYKLTGEKSLELNWAAESGCFDIRKEVWFSSLLDQYHFSDNLFPKVHYPAEIVGETTNVLKQEGLRAGIPVIAGSADHIASALGAGITKQGDVLIKFGGAGDILFCTDSIVTSEKLFFDYHDIPGKYVLNGCMASSGSLVKWFIKDVLHEKSGEAIKELDNYAAYVKPASEGLIVLPYFLGEKTPIFDSEARGTIIGLTLSHTQYHIYRAILESVIYGFRHHLDVMHEIGYDAIRIKATDGGAKSPVWCQIAADILGTDICAFENHPGSALGVSFLSGIQAGLFNDYSEVDRILPKEIHFRPMKRTDLYTMKHIRFIVNYITR